MQFSALASPLQLCVLHVLSPALVFASQNLTVEAQHCALLMSFAGVICYPVCCNLQPILLCCNDIEGIGLRQLVTHFWQEYLAMGEWQLAEL